MAAKEKPDAAPAEAAAPAAPKKSMLTSTPVIVAIVAIVEAGLFFGASAMFGGGPQQTYGAEGEHAAHGEEPKPDETTTEIELISKFRIPNDKSGQPYLYDFDIYLKVKEADAEHIQELIDNHQSEILDNLSQIVRGSDPPVLHEPALKTLRLKIRHMLGELIGDPEAIVEILIPRCVPMRAG
jgi:hypothetical protein